MTEAELPRAVVRLQALVRIPTVSFVDPALVDTAAFDALVAELGRQFPLLHQHLVPTRVGTHGLLFHWPGHAATRPLVLMAHLDVVPAGELARWRHTPFAAEVHDGAVWGRGTLDDKGALTAICEAVETLLERGFTPAQDVWLSFGCDEEVSGAAARAAVAELVRRGVRPWLVLDEGGAIAHEAFPGVTAPLGVIGVAEKGVAALELRVEGRGGHASTPARLGPAARLARAITRLDRSPMPPRVPEPTVELLRRMAPHAPAPMRPLLANAGRLRPLLARALVAAGPEPAATTRTTFAVTTLTGSPAPNVIADTVRAGLNLRIMVGDTLAGALEHLRRVVADDEVRVEVLAGSEPSPVSPVEDEAFRLLESVTGQIFADVVPAPYVLMAATDSRYFTTVCDRVYRFTPLRMTKAQRASIHGCDEHVRVVDLLDAVRWYARLIEDLPA